MGYRALLAAYMRHVEAVIGTSLVEIAGLTNALSVRQLGELRSIAAQVKRESYEQTGVAVDFDQVVRRLLLEKKLHIEDLAAIEGFNPGPADEKLSESDFSRILMNLVKFQSDSVR